ncbi:PepSY-associated TM helix domain-containing protein [Dickeya fangzhongdai]|uniref:PepSY-associated TM helix domain-containing protein n=1 Tax=Dickeya fangzhongdai TaxID=1778540 RepID=UPI001ADC0CD9|nr:PepSY-associated TM helix domain-containing protein [Dickeya fangzhongdai]MBO8132250.1 PepSY domain-containing protein [Dickeya fangzhongdai]
MSESKTETSFIQAGAVIDTPLTYDATRNSQVRSQRAALQALLMRLHFYIGLFIGPFIFIAALTGTLYVLTPQIESKLYSHQLFTDAAGAPTLLSQQITAATHALGDKAQHARLTAVRPAPEAGQTTRVMFSLPDLGPSESFAVFVDPVSLDIRGALTVYGTSGILPFRTSLDYLHRSLLLGDLGRNYSELAASWLWIAALGGLYIWISTRKNHPRLHHRPAAGRLSPARQRQRLRSNHAVTGLLLLVGLLFFSATGLTWSRWAGDNVAQLRAVMGWQTPSVNTRLDTATPPPPSAHAEHDMMSMPMPMHPAVSQTTPQTFDSVLAAARAAGIDAGKIEIRPASRVQRAWTVSEIDRAWPTQVDAVAIDPMTFRVIDKVNFADYPLVAKLTRWGIDAHMGVLFGLANQLLLSAFGLGLCSLIVWGYRMWWSRRPARPSPYNPLQTLTTAFLQLNGRLRLLVLVIAGALAVSLPVMGSSLVMFLLVDIWRWSRQRQTA